MATLASMHWVIDIPRTVVALLAGVLATLVAVPIVMITAAINDVSPHIERVIRAWSRVWLVCSFTRLDVEGQENVDPTRSYVVVANHLSALDIMACVLAVRLPMRFLAKTELFKVPVFAQGMRAVGIVEVDRAARGSIHADVNRQGKALIEKGRSLIIYAEGTRPRNGVMKPFKKGAFTMALTSQLPVLPLSIHGSYEAWPPGQPWLHGGRIRVVIDPAIETTGMTQADGNELRDQVRDVIAGRVSAMGGKVGLV
ncbi:MAG TPA: lysophospholipid acyltransferase family protein [Acidimicrobiia bacterium]|nr:lysophospholipid acyltransferase family protein [Acidimicrobiia bacterium]